MLFRNLQGEPVGADACIRPGTFPDKDVFRQQKTPSELASESVCQFLSEVDTCPVVTAIVGSAGIIKNHFYGIGRSVITA